MSDVPIPERRAITRVIDEVEDGLCRTAFTNGRQKARKEITDHDGHDTSFADPVDDLVDFPKVE